jgi:3alpha(or 20beta)-hydroxysteroid dehydrogenase
MNTTSKKLEGKVAIITGAARGQGADEARRFVAEGARVVLTDLLPSGANVAAELGDAAIFIQHDVANEAQWRNVVDTALAKFGRVDILVNNAGIFTPAMLEDTTAESFDRHYRVNQYGPFLGMKAVLEAMKAAGGGSIVNISSVAGMRGFPGMIAYAGSKWALRGMTKCVAREVAPFKIRVNSIHPGLVDTPMLNDHDPEALKQFEAAVPLGRMATTADVVEIVVYLACDLSSNMTGAELVTDGGLGL